MFDATALPDLHGQEALALVAQRSGDGAGVELVEPITLEQAKSHLRVVGDDEDADISLMITTARQAAEQRINRLLVQRPLVAGFANWCGMMRLPKASPLISVEGVEYLDTDGISQPFTEFDVFDLEEPARVELAYGAAVPALRYRRDAIRVKYTAGYAEGEVPSPLISWMLLVIGTLYENRETMVAGVQVYNIPEDFMSLLIHPYVVYE